MPLSISSGDSGFALSAHTVASPRGLRWITVAGLVLANLLVLALSVNSLYLSRRHYEERTEILTQNIASALDQNLSGSIEKIDLALRVVVDEIERQLADKGIDESSMVSFLARQETRLPQVEALRVAQADGLVILGRGLNKAERASWVDRGYFEFLKLHPEGGLHISKPLFGRVSKQYIINFSRRYNNPDGSFGGVASAPIALDYFSQILAQFDLGPSGSLILRDADVGLITRVPAIPNRPAGQVGDTSVSKEFRRIFESGVRTASYYTSLGADGLQRISTFHRLQQAPMVVIVSMGKSDYLAGWNQEVYRSVAVVSGFLLVSVLLGTFLLRAQKQNEQNRLQLELKLVEISALQDLLQEQAIHDPLTGLYNRRYLDETLVRDVSRAKREGYSLSLIMLDLDDFKAVNDNYGHAAGDKVLKTLASLLMDGARESDTVCRYGGEEFLIVLPRMSLDQAQQKADAWRLQFAETTISYGSFSLRVTFSAGIAAYPQHAADPDNLVGCADAALYSAKAAGRNRVTRFDAGAAPATEIG